VEQSEEVAINALGTNTKRQGDNMSKSLGVAVRGLHDIDDVADFDESDQICLDEVRSVIEKHSKLDRFGVQALRCV
jgi:hypothetical protein